MAGIIYGHDIRGQKIIIFPYVFGFIAKQRVLYLLIIADMKIGHQIMQKTILKFKSSLYQN